MKGDINQYKTPEILKRFMQIGDSRLSVTLRSVVEHVTVTEHDPRYLAMKVLDNELEKI